ncbi:MAG: Hsp20/alpha crystallin family protein [Candidatus Omnitrophota bacterium]
MLKTRTIVFPTVLTAALMAGGLVHAANASTDEIKALKEQIAQLQAKVTQLEQQSGQNPAAVKPAAAALVKDDDYADPFEHMAAMDRQMQALMSGFGMPMNLGMNARSAAFAPDYDIKSTDKGYVISFDMPGMDKSKINVEVKNGALVVSGERSSENKEDQGGKFYRQQRSFGYFSRVIPLPQDVKPETVAAKYDNGVLNITIDKKEAEKQAPAKQKIEVR